MNLLNSMKSLQRIQRRVVAEELTEDGLAVERVQSAHKHTHSD